VNLGSHSLAVTPVAVRWTALLALSTGVSLGLSASGLPAALLLGPMIAGIVFGVNGVRLEVPSAAYLGAQGMIGAMVAASITPSIVATFGQHYALLFAVVGATVFGATALGWLISRTGWIPGPTAVYGTSPGAAGAMVVLAEAEGADARMVAFMQYVRVLLVALVTALVARLWPGVVSGHTQGAGWFDPVEWSGLAAVVLIVVLAQQMARLLRVQAWAVPGPMFVLSVLHAGGWLPIALPRWLLAAVYGVIGWRIGLGFRREELIYARNALPVVIGAAVLLMSFCGLLACCLGRLAGVDPLTAYLATSPGGLDSVAIIAASTPGTDLSFVLALQSLRLLLVIGLAPVITRFVIRRSSHLQAQGDA
jgi:membrane AbrB-like protein